jgi:hypothetical protein
VRKDHDFKSLRLYDENPQRVFYDMRKLADDKPVTVNFELILRFQIKYSMMMMTFKTSPSTKNTI